MSKNKKVAKKYWENKEDKDINESKDPKQYRPKRGKDFKSDEKRRGRNDISWYTPDSQLLNDAGRWPYSTPVGTPLSRDSIMGLADRADYAVPGICAARVYLTLGNCQNGQSATNVAANSVYTYVRHDNSGSRNYDSNDLMLMITAMDSVYSIATWITRLYATVGMYASMNKYLPDDLALLQNNVDLDSIRDNMANFRARFNALVMKIGSIVVPASMPIFQRHSYLFQNYYSEGPSIKDQIYFCYPANFYTFQLDSSGAGMLKNHEISDYSNSLGKLDADGLIRIMEDMITPIFNDEDMNIMSGDILKSYGSNILKLALLPDLLIAQPINNIVFLEQFKNMRTVFRGFPTNSNVLDITQDANKEYLKIDLSDVALFRDASSSSPYWDSNQSGDPDLYRIAYDEWSRNLILTTEVSDVSPENNMLITRDIFMPEFELDTTVPSGISIKEWAFGSEIFAGVTYLLHDDSWNRIGPTLPSVITYDATDPSSVQNINQWLTFISSFRFHPAHTFVGYDKSTSPTTYVPAGLPNLGIDNFTTIDFDHVKVLHDVAILGEFNVPRLAVVK